MTIVFPSVSDGNTTVYVNVYQRFRGRSVVFLLRGSQCISAYQLLTVQVSLASIEEPHMLWDG